MIEKAIEIRISDGVSEGYIYRPADAGVWPGVIHLTDIGGIREAPREMARRLSAEGYVVLLPNIFYRTSKTPVWDFPRKMGEERTMKRFGELTTPLTPDAMVRDVSSYVHFLAQQKGVKDGPFGIVGYCFTGAMALRGAAALPDKIAAIASFHGGGLYKDTPDSPHTVLPQVKARLYFGHAVEDRSMSKEAIEKFEAALASWGENFESDTYEGALHAWTMPDSPVYNEPQAERAYQKLTELFAAALSSGR